MEKILPGKEGEPSSRVNFRESFYEKKVDLNSLPEPTLRSARACSDCPALIRFAQLGERRCLVGPTRWVTQLS